MPNYLDSDSGTFLRIAVSFDFFHPPCGGPLAVRCRSWIDYSARGERGEDAICSVPRDTRNGTYQADRS